MARYRVQVRVRDLWCYLRLAGHLPRAPISSASPREALSMRKLQGHVSLSPRVEAALQAAPARLCAAPEEAPLRALQQTFLQEAGVARAHEDARERGSPERVHMPRLRQGGVQQDLLDRAPAQAHRREAARLRFMWQRVHLAELSQRSSAHPHRREAPQVHPLRETVHPENHAGGPSQGPYRRSTVPLHLLSQIVRLENYAQLPPEDAR